MKKKYNITITFFSLLCFIQLNGMNGEDGQNSQQPPQNHEYHTHVTNSFVFPKTPESFNEYIKKLTENNDNDNSLAGMAKKGFVKAVTEAAVYLIRDGVEYGLHKGIEIVSGPSKTDQIQDHLINIQVLQQYIANLDFFHKKGMITQEEYDQARKEIITNCKEQIKRGNKLTKTNTNVSGLFSHIAVGGQKVFNGTKDRWNSLTPEAKRNIKIGTGSSSSVVALCFISLILRNLITEDYSDMLLSSCF